MNTKKDRKNLYMKASNLDLITRLKPLLEKSGYMLRPSDQKFVPRVAGSTWDAPWIYTKGELTIRCDIYHRIMFNLLDHIHSACRDCWKIVVRPRTIIELLDLYELQKEMDVPCKCGLELRSTVCGLYGGYFYTRSKEAGLERYSEVRKAVDEAISPDVPVILKRYCTEFEIGKGSKGPSDKVGPVTPEELAYEKYVEAHFPSVGESGGQAEHVIANTIKRWIHHAFEHGDLSYLGLTNGEKLIPDYVTYHNVKEN